MSSLAFYKFCFKMLLSCKRNYNFFYLLHHSNIPPFFLKTINLYVINYNPICIKKNVINNKLDCTY